MRKSRKDNNHNEIVGTLSSLYIPFCDLSHVGGGIPDGLVYLQGKWEWVEFKNREWSYGKKGLNANQLEWLKKFPCATVYIIESVDDAIALARGELKDIKCISA